MRYAIPQFVEVEDKVIGPLTVRQFIYLVAGGVFLVICWALADLGLFIFLAVITVLVTVSFAFVKINGRPFQIFLSAFTKFYSRPRVRTWFRESIEQRIKTKIEKAEVIPIVEEEEVVLHEGRRLVSSNLENLSNILDQEMVADLLASQQDIEQQE